MKRDVLGAPTRHLIGIAMAVILVLSVLGCGASAPTPSSSAPPASKSASSSTAPASSPAVSAEDAEWQKIVDAAKKEGKVVIYGTSSEVEVDEYTKAFGKAYPEIKLEFVNLRGAEALAKLKAEQAAGKNLSDIIRGGGPTPREAAKDGLTFEFVPPEVKKSGIQWLIDPLLDSKELGGNKILMTYLTIYYVMINTDLVKPADEPKSFKDLSNPKYKGMISFDDPRMDGPGNRAFSLLYKLYGEEWVKSLLANGLRYSRDYYENPKRVARGELAILVMPTSTMADPVLGQNLPIKMLTPEEGNPLLTNAFAGVKGGPNPNAAKVFLNFLFTQEGQTAISQGGGTPIRSGVSAKRPEFDLTGKKPFPGTPTTFEVETTYFKEMAQKARDLIGQ